MAGRCRPARLAARWMGGRALRLSGAGGLVTHREACALADLLSDG